MIAIEPLQSSAKLPWESNTEIIVAPTYLPRLSVVMPIYNVGTHLERTLRSLACNDLTNVEIIVQDGGSNDDTHAVIHHYKSMFSQIYSEADLGQSDAINKGFSKSSGDIFYWLNGDDILCPNALTFVRQAFSDDAHCNVLVGNAYMCQLGLEPIRHFDFDPAKLTFEFLLDYAKNHLVQPSVFFSRAAWESCGPLDIDDHYAMDADLFLTMAKKYRLTHLPVDLAYSVYHEDCKTRRARAESICALAQVQAKHQGYKEMGTTLAVLIDHVNQILSDVTTVSGSHVVESFWKKKYRALADLVEQKQRAATAALRER